MPQGDDYTPTTSGTLKLKGVKASKVEKHKKKRKRPAADDLSVKPTLSNSKKKDKEDNGDDGIRGVKKKRNEEGKSEREEMIDEALAEEMGIEEARGNNDEDGEERITGAGKTEAERRHDESRRKRVCPIPNYDFSAPRWRDGRGGEMGLRWVL